MREGLEIVGRRNVERLLGRTRKGIHFGARSEYAFDAFVRVRKSGRFARFLDMRSPVAIDPASI